MKKLLNLKFFENMTEKGKGNLIVLLGVLGILFITMGDFNFFSDANVNKDSSIILSEYKQGIEKEITALLKEIDGVGNVKVMVTLEATEETIYAQEEKNAEDQQINSGEKASQENIKSTSENKIVIVGNSNDKAALVEKTIQPSIQGVAVVCTGADDVSVVSAVTNSVSVVLNVPTHRICVTKMR